MSFIRRSGAVASRLRALAASNGQCGSSAALGGPSDLGAAGMATQALLHMAPQASNWGSSSQSPFSPHFRNFSFFPGSSGAKSSDDTVAAASLPDGSEGDAAAPLVAEPSSSGFSYSPDAIIDAAGLAENAALEAAMEGAWAPTRLLQWTLTEVHNATGLPWWLSIALTTVGIRATSYPITLMQIKNTYRLSQARPEIEALLAHLKEEQARGNQNATAEYQQRVMHVWKKYNANPMKSFASMLVQAPLFIGFFSALRGLAAAKVPSLVEGGAFWFTDLSVADPTYMLPIISSATFLLTIEAGAADGMEGQTDVMKKRMKNIMRAVAVIIVPFTVSLPASVFCYWATSNAFSLFQTMVLKLPGVRPALGLPDPKAMAAAAAGVEAGKPIATFAQKPPAAQKPKKK